MFDIHCHLLPGIDDGPQSLTDALELARIACRNGITHAVVTPHITPGRYDNSLDTIRPVFSMFAHALQNNHIPLHIGMAAEVHLDPLIMSMVETGTLPFLGEHGGQSVVLLEFPHRSIPPGSHEMVTWLFKRNIKPMIAHPERNQAVIKDYRILQPFIKAGCLLQITAGSMTGVFGSGPEKTASVLLEQEWVTVVASDAHNRQKRPPDLTSCKSVLESVVGRDEARAMVFERPRSITLQHFTTKA